MRLSMQPASISSYTIVLHGLLWKKDIELALQIWEE